MAGANSSHLYYNGLYSIGPYAIDVIFIIKTNRHGAKKIVDRQLANSIDDSIKNIKDLQQAKHAEKTKRKSS